VLSRDDNYSSYPQIEGEVFYLDDSLIRPTVEEGVGGVFRVQLIVYSEGV